MNHRAARHMVNILMESPFYLGLTLEERHQLVTDLLTTYSLTPDNGPERESTEESGANAK